MKYGPLLIALLLLAVPALAEVIPAPQPTGSIVYADNGTIWNISSAPFEWNNETAYNEDQFQIFAPIMANLTYPANLTNMSWSEAFSAANSLMEERYAFSGLKAVDWDALYQTYAPAVAAAEKDQDKAAYFRALRGYIYAIPDGHVSLLPAEGDFGAKYADIGGDYGVAVTRLDSGTVIVSFVANRSQAEQAGIRFGDVVTAWNGREILDAINTTSYIWAVKKPSTAEGIRLHQQRLLTRGPIGSTATITISNSTASLPRTVTLTAYDDGYANLKQTSWFLGIPVNDYGVDRSWEDILPQISNETVTVRTLPGNYTYIAVYNEEYDVYQPFKAAMQNAIANNTPGIVFDLRFNSGGDDSLAACFASWFVKKPAFYEYATKYDPGNGRFTTLSEAWSIPRADGYSGPVAVLVSPDTISSGEGVPMILNRTGRGEVISFYGTNGAFGMNNVQASLPLGLSLYFPDGASLDLNGTIQDDSNAGLTGGVSPGIRVPINEDTVARSMAGEDVQLTYALQWLKGQGNQTSASKPSLSSIPARKTSLDFTAALGALGILVMVAGRK
ncbi:S41 family peptidase [Methanosphaerula palustris]|uniref:Peptidase S41 n=1 Tax=Methanosphaerula palustris (strain ATCC BAA-1556 / DSM 19958 / E1-9c) TaxID=521011 RepID=B8GE05_METPE|nr:S41 family peptidase [Methanosphaerula palustris]ACL17506.1 peptidase S41 [Methanosphaerula palustris E1-9c]